MFGFLFAKKTPATKQPRRYQVPEGLVETVLGLWDAEKTSRSPRIAHKQLWELLEKRCPECEDGTWSIAQEGRHVFIVEKLPK